MNENYSTAAENIYRGDYCVCQNRPFWPKKGANFGKNLQNFSKKVLTGKQLHKK